MTEQPAKDSFEYWFEVILLSIGLVVGATLGIYGHVACTPFHPCPVWAQIVYGLGWALFGMFGNALIIIWFLFAVAHMARKLK